MSRYWYTEMQEAAEARAQRARIKMAEEGCDLRSHGQRLWDALNPPGSPRPPRERRVIEPNE
jgi:hypothetical protein